MSHTTLMPDERALVEKYLAILRAQLRGENKTRRSLTSLTKEIARRVEHRLLESAEGYSV